MGDRIRYAVIPRPGAPVEVREVAPPEPAPGEVHLAVELSEVCGTDVHLQAGRLEGVPYPLIPGHVSIGRVSAVRGDVCDVHGRPVREGDRTAWSRKRPPVVPTVRSTGSPTARPTVSSGVGPSASC